MSKNYCPNCKRITNHKTIHKKKLTSNSDDDFHWTEEFEIIECAGCENTQFRYTYSDETMSNYSDIGEELGYYDEIKCYPLSLKNHVPLKNLYGLPLKIKTIYNETLESFKLGS